MSPRAIYCYAWDLAEVGPKTAMAEFRGLGLDTVTMATSYHAGKFLRPRMKGKTYFPEDGTAYFRFDPSRYGAIKPVANSLLTDRDVLRELCENGDMAVNGWTVLLHNSRLGEAHPGACAETAFGDRLIYSLCPSAPEAREYAVALVRDLTDNYPLAGVSLESPGFAPYPHSYHHEFALIRWNRWLESLFGLCFCAHCRAGAKKAGIGAEALRAQVVGDVAAYLDGEADYPDDMAEAFWRADLATDRELSAYMAFRCEVVTSLVAEIRDVVRRDAAVAVIPSVARPTGGAWYEGSDIRSLAGAADAIEACFYEPSADRVAADLSDIRRRMRGQGRLRGILRPAPPDLDSEAALVAAAEILRDGGVEGIAFYNWGFLRPKNLRAVAAAAEAFGR